MHGSGEVSRHFMENKNSRFKLSLHGQNQFFTTALKVYLTQMAMQISIYPADVTCRNILEFLVSTHRYRCLCSSGIGIKALTLVIISRHNKNLTPS